MYLANGYLFKDKRAAYARGSFKSVTTINGELYRSLKQAKRVYTGFSVEKVKNGYVLRKKFGTLTLKVYIEKKGDKMLLVKSRSVERGVK